MILIYPRDVPIQLVERLARAGVDYPEDVHKHILAGTLQSLKGIGPWWEQRILRYYTADTNTTGMVGEFLSVLRELRPDVRWEIQQAASRHWDVSAYKTVDGQEQEVEAHYIRLDERVSPSGMARIVAGEAQRGIKRRRY